MKKCLPFLMTFLCISSAVFADDTAPARQQSMMQTMMMIGVALLFFYMILWRPEQKKRKKMAQQRASMKAGDRVTAMGVVGRLSETNEQTVVLEMVDGSKIEMLKAAISDVKSPEEHTVTDS